MQAPGAVRERMEVVMPNFSLTFWSSSGVHSGMNQPDGSPPETSRAVKYARLVGMTYKC